MMVASHVEGSVLGASSLPLSSKLANLEKSKGEHGSILSAMPVMIC